MTLDKRDRLITRINVFCKGQKVSKLNAQKKSSGLALSVFEASFEVFNKADCFDLPFHER